MPLTVTSKRKNAPDSGSLDAKGQRIHQVTFIVDQTDAGPLADGIGIVLAAQALVSGRVPLIGEEYDDFTQDLDSFCQSITWNRIEAEHGVPRWEVVCTFGPAEDVDPGTILEPDPLLRPVEFDVDYIEEQVPLDEAAIVEDLGHVGRDPDSVGPVVNSCGVEFTEGLLKTIYYPVLVVRKNYATLEEIIALNLAFQNTTNDDTFYGAPARCAKYLSTASGGRQQINGVSFYSGTTRIWFKDVTWDRFVLNNGWGHFKLYEDPLNPGDFLYEGNTGGNGPTLFKNKVHDAPPAEEGGDVGDPDADASEPLNLAVDGTLLPSDTEAIYLTYRDLNAVDYTGIGIGG